MQNELMIFKHEQFGEVRIVDNEGNPWFVLRDILTAMESSTPPHVARKTIEDMFGDGHNFVTPIVDALGRTQETNIVSESAATFIIARGNTEKSKVLNRWIHTEVLPSIRKTGSYSTAEPSMSMVPVAREYRVAIQIAELSGLKDNQAILAADKATRKFTGHSPLGLMGITHLICEVQEDHLTAGDIGKIVGVSAQKVNKMLETAGIIESYRDHKNRLKWTSTEAGKPHTILKDTGKKHGNGTPVQQLLFLRPVVNFLKNMEVD